MNEPTQKKGLSPLAWIAIGCGALVVISGVVFVGAGWWVANKAKGFIEEARDNPALATAKLIAKLNPEIEVVDADNDTQSVTIRNVKSGEVITVDLEDLKEGRISFEKDGERVDLGVDGDSESFGVTVRDEEGNVKGRYGVSQQAPPDWVPYDRDAQVSGTYLGETNDEVAGGFTHPASGSVEEAAELYESLLEDGGYDIEKHTVSSGEGSMTTLVGKNEAEDRTVTVTVTGGGDATQVMVAFKGEKG